MAGRPSMEAPHRALLPALAVAALTIVWLCIQSPTALAAPVCGGAATYTVQWGNDEADGTNTAGPDGKLSLQEAVGAAQNHSGPATIVLPAGHYLLSDGLPLQASCGLTIQGAGARSTIVDGQNRGYVFANDGTTTVDGVTITGGHNGAGGGALSNSGTLTVTNDAFVGNAAEYGGAIANMPGKTLTVSGSTFSDNTSGGSTMKELGGGAIWNDGSATITNSTIAGNSAEANPHSGGLGGGIYTENAGTTNLQFVTLDHNSATGASAEGGNVGGSTVNRLSTIFAAGSPNDCSTAASAGDSGDRSISDDGSCGTSEIVQADPKLGPLQNNGGPTDTEMLLPGSPAIDGGELAQCQAAGLNVATVDQRGINRPQGTSCDIGAYELVQTANLALTGSATPSQVTLGQNVTLNFSIASSGVPGDGVPPTLTDVLPAGLQYVSGSPGCSASGQTVTCNPGTVEDGFILPVAIVARTNAVGSLSNTATVSSPRPDSNPGDDSATVSVAVQPAASGQGNSNSNGSLSQLLERLGLSNSTFRALGSGGPVAAAKKRRPLGTTVSYTLASAARVTFTVQKPVLGHSKGRRCVSGAPKRHGKKRQKGCTLLRAVGSFTVNGSAGTNHFKFTGRLGGRKLKPGQYLLVAVATDSTGHRYPAVKVKFTIAK